MPKRVLSVRFKAAELAKVIASHPQCLDRDNMPGECHAIGEIEADGKALAGELIAVSFGWSDETEEIVHCGFCGQATTPGGRVFAEDENAPAAFCSVACTVEWFKAADADPATCDACGAPRDEDGLCEAGCQPSLHAAACPSCGTPETPHYDDGGDFVAYLCEKCCDANG